MISIGKEHRRYKINANSDYIVDGVYFLLLALLHFLKCVQ